MSLVRFKINQNINFCQMTEIPICTNLKLKFLLVEITNYADWTLHHDISILFKYTKSESDFCPRQGTFSLHEGLDPESLFFTLTKSQSFSTWKFIIINSFRKQNLKTN